MTRYDESIVTDFRPTNSCIIQPAGTHQIQTARLERGEKRAAVKINDDSLTGFGIERGDICVVMLTDDVYSGQLVFAVTNEGATKKKLIRAMFVSNTLDGHLVLASGNEFYEPKRHNIMDVDIKGHVAWIEKPVRGYDNQVLFYEQVDVPRDTRTLTSLIHGSNHTLAQKFKSRKGTVVPFGANVLGAVTRVGHQVKLATGHEPHQFIGSDWARQLHHQDRERVMRHWFDCVSESRTFEDEFRMLTADGGVRNTTSRFEPVTKGDLAFGWTGANEIEDRTEYTN